MKRLRLRALVLTAGHGIRLRPLSLFIPKPVLPIRGEPVVGTTLRGLKKLGCEAAVLNLHHLAEAVTSSLGQSYYGLPLVYAREEVILGTLGPLYPQRDFLAAADLILLVNGDSLCRWPFRAMIRQHQRAGADATLLVHRKAPTEAFGGGIGVDSRGRVVQLRDYEPVGEVARRVVFAGAHVLSPRLLNRVGEGPGDIISDLYQPLLREGGPLMTVATSRPWHDLGTPERYLEAVSSWGRGRWRWLSRRRSEVSKLALVSPGAVVVDSVIEPWAVVEKDVRIEGSILLPGARVASGSRIQSSIIGPGVRLGAASIERRMINRAKTDYQLAEHESVMGELVYTPI
ncbi:MAG: NDP-sugar synthase [Thermoanaerobaculia bacterium]